MKKTRSQRLLSLMLAMLFLLSSATIAVGASDMVLSDSSLGTPTDGNSSVSDSTIDDVKELLTTLSYSDYCKTDAFNNTARATSEIAIDVFGYDKDMTDADVHEETYDGVKGLYTPSSGTVAWKVNIPATAKYSVVLEYYPVEAKASSVERIFRINNKIPFAESRYLQLNKVWKNDYVGGEFKLETGESADSYISAASAVGITAVSETRDSGTYIVYTMPSAWTQANVNLLNDLSVRFFVNDIDKNEIRPNMMQTPEWCTYELSDIDGYYADTFEYVLEVGENIISLEGINEPMAISSIKLIPHEDRQSYADYQAKVGTTAGSDAIKIEAEYPGNSSSQTIYPVENHTSAITSPISAKKTYLNTIGGEKWQSAGQWLRYSFSVENSGNYAIIARYLQATLEGMYVSREVSITTDYSYEEYVAKFGNDKGYYNGVPFAEAAQTRFDYSDSWRVEAIGTKEQDFEFYFEAGVVYTVSFEVTLGTMGPTVQQVEASLESINNNYLEVLRLTGANPDEYRDYAFSRVLPDVGKNFVLQSRIRYNLVDQLAQESGGVSSMSSTIEQIAWLLDKMGHDPEDEIAKNLSQLKSYIGTMGTWVTDAKAQPLVLDYILIQPIDAERPRANASFWQSLVHEISGFFQSFFRNYNRMGATSEDSTADDAVEVWLAYGRDQAQVVRNLVNNNFTPNSNIPVNLKLVAGGTLLPSILAQKGPDVYIGLGQGDVINYAIRGALESIEDMPGFNEFALDPATAEFTEAAMIVMGIPDALGDFHYYGLPETQNFPMMFVREDILASLGIDIPKTWDDLLAAVPTLQANKMEIGFPNDYQIFLYQKGGELFADGGMRINLDSNLALESFEMMCNMFTMYSFPYKYDAANRFRTGEMPIVMAAYTGTYNQLKVFATEIEGLWSFYPMPGIEDENGEINNVSVSSASAIVMISGCDQREGAWEFMKWHSGAYCQTEYSNEMVAIMGDSAKHATANIKALESLPWTTKEYTQLSYQFNNLASIPNYPGSYIIGRYTNFAFLAAYNDKANPVDELRSHVYTINKEITRKRKEFELETLDVGTTLVQKRASQILKFFEDGELVVEEGERNKKDEVVLVEVTYTMSDAAMSAQASLISSIKAALAETVLNVDDLYRLSNEAKALVTDGKVSGSDVDAFTKLAAFLYDMAYYQSTY